jgi:hypothetical protein
LRRLSLRLPDLILHLHFDPDGADGTLRAGELVLDGSAALASWVAAHPRPQFAGGALTANLELHAPVAERAALRTSLARRTQATLTDVAEGFVLAATGARELLQAFDAAKAMMLVEPPWRLSLELSGAVSSRISVDDVVKLLALDNVIATWLRGAKVPEPVVAVVAPPVAALPPAPALARIAEPDRLVLELDDRSRFALARDGKLELLAPREPFSWSRGRVLGEVDGEQVVAFTLELQLGRIRSAVGMRARDGSQRTSADLINAAAIVLDRDRRRVLATPERDGVRELVAIDLGTMDVAPLRTLALDPRELFVCRDSIVALVSEPRRFQLIRLSEQSDADVPIATWRARPWRWTRRDDALQLIALDEASTPAAATYCEVSLVDGSMRSVPVGHGHSSTFAVSGDWLAWCDQDDAAEVRLFHAFELKRTIAARAGFHTWSVDVSPSGAVARVVTDDKSSLLDVIRDDDRVELAIPLGAAAEWALDGRDLRPASSAAEGQRGSIDL